MVLQGAYIVHPMYTGIYFVMNFAMQQEHTNSILQFYHYFNAIAISEIFF